MGKVKRIIIEGPDGAGKTTLVNQLATHLDSGAMRFAPSFKDKIHQFDFTGYMQWIMSQVFEDPVIHDRLFYSELVYGPILRGKVDMSGMHVDYYRGWLESEAFLVYCRVPFDKLLERVTMNPQMEGVIPSLAKIYKAYDEVMGQALPRYWIRNAAANYDGTPDSLRSTLKLIEDYING